MFLNTKFPLYYLIYLIKREIGHGLSGPVFDSKQQHAFFHINKTSRPALVPTQPPIQWVHGLFPGVKRPRLDVYHLSSSIGEVTNEWSCTSISPIRLHNLDLHFVHLTTIPIGDCSIASNGSMTSDKMNWRECGKNPSLTDF